MTKIIFDSVLICDSQFYYKKIHGNFTLLRKLMYINVNSKDHKRNHVRISGKSFEEILEENPKLKDNKDILQAAFRRCTEPESIEGEEDEVTRTVKHAIDATTTAPFKSIILTTEEKSKEYSQNQHFKKMKEVSFVTGEEALFLIDDYFGLCMDKEKY